MSLNQHSTNCHSLNRRVTIRNGKNVLIMAYWRTGSTFLGELISSYPGVFYTFEPFYTTNLDIAAKVELLKQAFQCEFSESYTRQRLVGSYDYLDTNFRWFSVCKNLFDNRTACGLSEFTNSVCLKHPIRLVKVVSMKAQYVKSLLSYFGSSLKVVYLTRDPRGVMSSRWRRDWCGLADNCSSTAHFCQSLAEDLTAFEDLKNQFPNQVLLKRYEDLVLNLSDQSKQLFEFLGLEPRHPFVENYITTHTDGKHQDPSLEKNLEGTMITFKEPQKVVFQWQQNLNSSQIKSIQDTCLKPMKRLGYAIMDDQNEENNLNNKTFNPLRCPEIKGFLN